MRKIKKRIFLLGITAMLLLTSISFVFAAENNSANLSAGSMISPGEKKAVPIFLLNDDLKAHDYALTAGGVTDNWELYFSLGGAPASTVTVQPGASSEADLNISLKNGALAESDNLTVKASRDDGKVETINLLVMINKDYLLSVGSILNQIDTLNGKTAEVSFSVTNGGAKELKNVKIEPALPYKWLASQSNEKGISLKPGETGTLKLKIDVPESQAAGNFTAKFSAVSDETKSAQISIPVTVRTSSNIGWWMIGGMLLIAGFTVAQFKRHGRR